MDEILAGCQAPPLLHRDVASHLYHPGLIGMGRDASHMDLPTPQMHEKQDIIRYQPAQRPHLGGEEVRRDQDIKMRADELFPRGGRLPLWRRWDAVALEDIAYCLITDRIAQVGQRTH